MLFASLVLAACQRGKAEGAKKREPAPVGVVTVVEQDVPFEVAAFGTVEASSSVDIVSQVTGRVMEVRFAEGDVVKKGDLLFSIDTRPYNASLAVAQAELARSRALAAQAQTEAERASRLEREGIASAQEATKARAEADSSAATVRLSQAAAQSAGLNVAFTKVKSPIDGRTGSLLVHAGNVVHAADTKPMVVIRNLTPVLVRFSVPEELLPTIRARQAQGPLTVRVTPRGKGARTVEGPLSFIENAVDEFSLDLVIEIRPLFEGHRLRSLGGSGSATHAVTVARLRNGKEQRNSQASHASSSSSSRGAALLRYFAS